MNDAVNTSDLLGDLQRLASEIRPARRRALVLQAVEKAHAKRRGGTGRMSRLWRDDIEDNQRLMLALSAIVGDCTTDEAVARAGLGSAQPKVSRSAAHRWIASVRAEYELLINSETFRMVKAADAASAGSIGELADIVVRQLAAELLSGIATGFDGMSIGDKHATLRGVDVVATFRKVESDAKLKDAQTRTLDAKLEKLLAAIDENEDAEKIKAARDELLSSIGKAMSPIAAEGAA